MHNQQSDNLRWGITVENVLNVMTAGAVDLFRPRVTPETLFLIFQMRNDAIFFLFISKDNELEELKDLISNELSTFFCRPQVDEEDKRISRPSNKLPVAG